MNLLPADMMGALAPQHPGYVLHGIVDIGSHIARLGLPLDDGRVFIQQVAMMHGQSSEFKYGQRVDSSREKLPADLVADGLLGGDGLPPPPESFYTTSFLIRLMRDELRAGSCALLEKGNIGETTRHDVFVYFPEDLPRNDRALAFRRIDTKCHDRLDEMHAVVQGRNGGSGDRHVVAGVVAAVVADGVAGAVVGSTGGDSECCMPVLVTIRAMSPIRALKWQQGPCDQHA